LGLWTLTIILQIEEPAQVERELIKTEMWSKVTDMESELFKLVRSKSISKHEISALFKEYTQLITEYHLLPEEIPWEMLSATAFVNSVSSTTGN
jgi:hypothetical protein